MRTLTRKFPHSDTESHDSFHDFPFPDADACVKCGLCLPHCPTYALHQHEGDSPRGRIALMQGLAEGRLPPQGNTVGHLDGCLVCRSEEHTSELQSRENLVCRPLLAKKKKSRTCRRRDTRGSNRDA